MIFKEDIQKTMKLKINGNFASKKKIKGIKDMRNN